MGFELKFEADVMALDCPTYNLSQHFAETRKAVENTTRHFCENKGWWIDQRLRNEDRNRKILGLYHSPNKSADEILEGHAEYYDGLAKSLKKEFDKLSLHD